MKKILKVIMLLTMGMAIAFTSVNANAATVEEREDTVIVKTINL